jgi:hypothetical protein
MGETNWAPSTVLKKIQQTIWSKVNGSGGHKTNVNEANKTIK